MSSKKPRESKCNIVERREVFFFFLCVRARACVERSRQMVHKPFLLKHPSLRVIWAYGLHQLNISLWTNQLILKRCAEFVISIPLVETQTKYYLHSRT